MKCTNCNETHENVIYFNLVEKQDMPGSRGQASFIQKCRVCERTGSIEYVGRHAPYEDQNEGWQTIAVFECRGWEFVEFLPERCFSAKSNVSEAMFGEQSQDGEPIDMTTERDWCGYDEDAEESVGIYDFQSRFIASKK